MNSPWFRIPALLLVLALAGCAALEVDPEREDPDIDPEVEIDEEDRVPRVIAAEDCPPDCPFERGAIDDPSSLLAERTIYFEFDSSRVRGEFIDTLKRHAEYLNRYTDVRVRLEGHTDERGTREYNMGLGERRGQSVEQLLRAYGVSRNQVEVISFGEEEPAVNESNEEAWEQNRRVEIVYPAGGGN